MYYIDQNRYRCTTFPLEPLFRSIYTLDPHFDPKPIDLFTDRNNLRKLTFAVSGISIQDFRIEVELVGDTLLFTRSEEQASEVVTQFRGFGHQFERKFTDYDDSALKKSTGHHRIVQQSVGGITFVVRFEVDGYFEEENTVPRDSKSDDRDEISDLATSLASMQVRQSRTLKVLRGGYKVSPNSLLELKTRAKHRPLHTSDVIYQLWFGQVPWLVVAYHMRGAFSQIKKEDFKDTGKFANFEAENKVEVTKLVRVIKNIKEALKKAGKTRGIVVYERELVLYEMSGNARSLPEDLLKKWE